MNIIQSKFTAYLNPETTGMGDEYSVPVKGTPYQKVKGSFGSVFHGTKGDREDSSAALRCGTKEAAIKVVSLMEKREPLSAVALAAAKGLMDYKEKHLKAQEAYTKEAQIAKARRREAELNDIWQGVKPHEGARFILEDVNPHFNFCGHYPEFKVRFSPVGEYESLEAAEKAAEEKNKRSHERWLRFLNS